MYFDTWPRAGKWEYICDKYYMNRVESQKELWRCHCCVVTFDSRPTMRAKALNAKRREKGMYRKGSITVNVADSEAAVHLSLTLGLGRWAEHWVLGYYGLHQNVTRWVLQ